MRYFVNLEDSQTGAVAAEAPMAATAKVAPIVVDLTELPSGALEVSVDGKRVAVDVVSIGGTLSVRVDGRIVDLTTEGSLPELGAVASGHRSYVRVESERQRAAAAAKNTHQGTNDKVVKSPMPGRVIRMHVAANDDAVAGQTLCVIEAMKMENEVKAKSACTIAAVHVTEGATVEVNGKLFTLA